MRHEHRRCAIVRQIPQAEPAAVLQRFGLALHPLDDTKWRDQLFATEALRDRIIELVQLFQRGTTFLGKTCQIRRIAIFRAHGMRLGQRTRVDGYPKLIPVPRCGIDVAHDGHQQIAGFTGVQPHVKRLTRHIEAPGLSAQNRSRQIEGGVQFDSNVGVVLGQQQRMKRASGAHGAWVHRQGRLHTVEIGAQAAGNIAQYVRIIICAHTSQYTTHCDGARQGMKVYWRVDLSRIAPAIWKMGAF